MQLAACTSPSILTPEFPFAKRLFELRAELNCFKPAGRRNLCRVVSRKNILPSWNIPQFFSINAKYSKNILFKLCKTHHFIRIALCPKRKQKRTWDSKFRTNVIREGAYFRMQFTVCTSPSILIPEFPFAKRLFELRAELNCFKPAGRRNLFRVLSRKVLHRSFSMEILWI
ncbi:hypothetical protein CEXT_124221 [Caerostris extrusa]|uniref:Uncharacterized protein n=1 Tax=Caerostris extrusa TaxID=172846 RepID=A0AAV4R4X1_CAEEX|nr:hypothetical protein CEXT_124221 [Caerostris extrusa]